MIGTTIGTFWNRQIEAAKLSDIAEKIEDAVRLSANDGLRLYQTPHLNVVGFLANRVRERKKWQRRLLGAQPAR